MTDKEIHSLYKHPKIKALISLTHGEGFGLPLYEAAYSGLPVIAPDWSGHVDFLYMPVKKNGKVRSRAAFAKVEYDISPVPDAVVWKGVIEKDSMWCYPKQGSYKMRLREVYKDHGRFKSTAKKLASYLNETFTEDKQYDLFVNNAFGENQTKAFEYVFVSDFFANEISGGAEFSLQTLIDNCDKEYINLNSKALNKQAVEAYKDKKWVFGNYSHLDTGIFSSVVDKLNYNIVEFDYKFCKYRNLDLHELLEGDKCDCAEKENGKTVEKFLSNANNVFFMSEEQKNIHLEKLKNLDADKCIVLSSVFKEDTIDKLRDLRKAYKNKKNDSWVVPGTPNWVKGSDNAKKWCEENNVDYVPLDGKSYDDALELLAQSKGLCFMPAGDDTCPRLVIEAKLLGCELQLNDNVQHANESWFDTSDLNEIEEYLKQVPQKFWHCVNE